MNQQVTNGGLETTEPSTAQPQPPKQVAMFVDGENITSKFRIDARALKEVLCGGREAAVAIWRDSYKNQPDYDKKEHYFRAIGYNFEIKPVAMKPNGNQIPKSRVDSFLMADMFARLLAEELGEQPRTQTWLLASGDSDFQPVLELLKARGREVEVAFVDGLSHELEQIAGRLINLNEHRDKVELAPKVQISEVQTPPDRVTQQTKPLGSFATKPTLTSRYKASQPRAEQQPNAQVSDIQIQIQLMDDTRVTISRRSNPAQFK